MAVYSNMRAILILLPLASALDNGLGKRPGLGWNSDYCANCSHVSQGGLGVSSAVTGFGGEHFVKSIADYMHSVPQAGAAGNSTLQQLGFHYVNMDASWNTATRDKNGKLVPTPSLWPSGIDQTVSYVHSLGLGFGLYGDRGDKDCAKNPGALGHEKSDAAQFGAWKIDWYKEDSCSAAGDHKTAFEQYGKMRDALNATGRQIWFALCGWKTWYGPPDASVGYGGGHSLGNSWRTGPDTGSGWANVMTNIENALSVSKYAGPTVHGGGWNDGSLQLTPGVGCKSEATCITETRQRSMYSAWCMLAMNLLLVGNFSALNPFVMETWSNPEILSINQDPGGQPAVQLLTAKLGEGYVRAAMAECGGEPDLQKWALGSDLSIRNSKANVCLNVEGCKSNIIFDSCRINATGVCGRNEEFVHDEHGHFVSKLPGSKCIAEGTDRTLSLTTCDDDESHQRFTLTNEGELVDSSGLCLTASSPTPSPSPAGSVLVIGRALSGDTTGGAAAAAARLRGGDVVRESGFALMILNNGAEEATITCDKACLQDLGLDVTRTYSVRDVWAHASLPPVDRPLFSLSAKVPGGGGSFVVRLTPINAVLI